MQAGLLREGICCLHGEALPHDKLADVQTTLPGEPP